MSNIEKLNNIFKEIFSVDDAALADLNKDNVDGWDSVHQLSLTSTIEDEFDIQIGQEAYEEYVSEGKISRPIDDLWKECDL